MSTPTSSSLSLDPFRAGLTQYGSQLIEEVDNILNLRSVDSQAACQQATLLHDIARKFNDYICNTPAHSNQQLTFEAVIKEAEIPLNIPIRLIHTFTNHSLQKYDELRLMMSKTARIFIELGVYQDQAQDRNADRSTVEELVRPLDDIKGALHHNKQFETEFEVECILASLRMWNIGIGKWRELGKDHSIPFVKALLESLVARNPSFLISPIIDLSVAIYRNMGKLWYKKVWMLRWYSAETKIHSLKQFSDLKEKLKLDKFRRKDKRAFYLNLFLLDMLQNSQTEAELKQHIVDTELPPSKFWEVRYTTVKKLNQLMENPGLSDRVGRLIVETWAKESNPKNKSDLQSVSFKVQPRLFTAARTIDISQQKAKAVQNQQEQSQPLERKRDKLKRALKRVLCGADQSGGNVQLDFAQVKAELEKQIGEIDATLNEIKTNTETEIKSWQSLENINSQEEWEKAFM